VTTIGRPCKSSRGHFHVLCSSWFILLLFLIPSFIMCRRVRGRVWWRRMTSLSSTWKDAPWRLRFDSCRNETRLVSITFVHFFACNCFFFRIHISLLWIFRIFSLHFLLPKPFLKSCPSLLSFFIHYVNWYILANIYILGRSLRSSHCLLAFLADRWGRALRHRRANQRRWHCPDSDLGHLPAGREWDRGLCAGARRNRRPTGIETNIQAE